MISSRSFFLTGCMVLILAAIGAAQTPSPTAQLPAEPTIRSWLLGKYPVSVAWGAHYAMLARDGNLIPDLLSLASRWQPLTRQTPNSGQPELTPKQTDQRDAMSAVLDALIQMKAPVPADTLRSLAPDFGNDVAVLLSRMPSGEIELLGFDLYRLQSPHTAGVQYVSAALLALHPVPGFAADMLTNVTVKAKVYAVLPGSGGIGGGSGGSFACILADGRAAWPVTGQYVLSKSKSDGATLLVAGNDPIYATRKESTRYRGDDDCKISGGMYLGSPERFRLIAEMLGVAPEAIPWKTDIQTRIEFQSVEQFDRELLAFVAGEQQNFRATAAALATRGLLSSAEAQEELLPKLELKLEDKRGPDAVPIPEPANLPSRVEWSPLPL